MNKKVWIGLGMILVIGAMVGTAIFSGMGAEKSVTVTQIKKEEIKEELMVSGTLEADQPFILYPEVGRDAPQLKVKLGEQVKKGTSLVTYSNPSKTVKSKGQGKVIYIGEPHRAITSGEPLVIVADPDQQKVTAEVSEFDALKVKKGQKVTIRFDALPDKKWQGQVSQVAYLPAESVDGMKGSSSGQIMYPVEIEINKHIPVKLGSHLIVEIATASQTVNSLPQDAVVNRKGKEVVFIVERGQAVEREVKLGVSSKGKVEIISGVKPEEQVIVKPPQDLEDGMEVKVQ